VAAANASEALFYPPGSAEDPAQEDLLEPTVYDDNAKNTLNQMRIPLATFAAQGVDLATVERVELAVDRTPSGSVQVADLALAR